MYLPLSLLAVKYVNVVHRMLEWKDTALGIELWPGLYLILSQTHWEHPREVAVSVIDHFVTSVLQIKATWVLVKFIVTAFILLLKKATKLLSENKGLKI